MEVAKREKVVGVLQEELNTEDTLGLMGTNTVLWVTARGPPCEGSDNVRGILFLEDSFLIRDLRTGFVDYHFGLAGCHQLGHVCAVTFRQRREQRPQANDL